jgi:hypothetical protein
MAVALFGAISIGCSCCDESICDVGHDSELSVVVSAGIEKASLSTRSVFSDGVPR